MYTGATIQTERGEFTLYLDNRAARLAEKGLGKPLAELNERSFAELSEVLLACLKRFHPGATIETVDAIIDDVGMLAAAEALMEAVADAPPFREKRKPE